jgi:hypothetical protein
MFWMFMRDTHGGQGRYLGLATQDGTHKKAWNVFVRIAGGEVSREN